MKNKIKISFIDILIILFFIIAIIAGIYRIHQNFLREYGIADSREHYEVVFDAVIGKDYAQNIASGDVVLDLDSEKFIGKINNVEFLDESIVKSLTENEVVVGKYINATISVSTATDTETNLTGTVSEDSSFIIGEKYKLAIPGVAFEGVCVSSEKIITVVDKRESRSSDTK